MILKICSKCCIEKESSLFPKRGLVCKSCKNEYKKNYYKLNKTQILESMAIKYQKNRDIRIAYAKEWNKNNKNKKIEYAKKYDLLNYKKKQEYRNINKEKLKQNRKIWAAKNPLKAKAYKVNGKAKRREREQTGKLSSGIIEKLYKLQKGKCPCCKQPLGKDFHVDHIMPLALGGTNTDDNVQLLKSRCNLQKSAKHPFDFMQEKGFLI